LKRAIAFALVSLFLTETSVAASTVCPTWKRYPYFTGLLAFPWAEGYHEGGRSEWWYGHFHLQGQESGRRYAVVVSYSTANSRVLGFVDRDRRTYSSTFQMGETLSCTDRQRIIFLSESRFDFWWQMGGAFNYVLFSQSEAFTLLLTMEALKPPHPLNGLGVVFQLPDTWTYYYALPRLEVEGYLITECGLEPVSGTGWIDRQWYFAQPGEIGGYHWFSLHLDDGTDIEAYQVFSPEGDLPFPLMDLIFQEGEHCSSRDFTITPSGYWEGPDQKLYATQWSIKEPAHGLDIRVEVDAVDQLAWMPLLGSFYEGSVSVTGTFRGVQVTGEGFAEQLYSLWDAGAAGP